MSADANPSKRQLSSKAEPAESQRDQYSLSVIDMIYALFDRAIQAEFADLPTAAVVITPSKVADYQCNSAMSISNAMKLAGLKTNPVECAKKIVANLEKNCLIEKCDVSGPGFINIYLSKSFAQAELRKLVVSGVKAPYVGEKKRVIIDFSSPNIAKEMHVGHLRSTIIGESLSRLFEFIGFDLLRWVTYFYFKWFSMLWKEN